MGGKELLHHKPPIAAKRLRNNRLSKSLGNLDVTIRFAPCRLDQIWYEEFPPALF